MHEVSGVIILKTILGRNKGDVLLIKAFNKRKKNQYLLIQQTIRSKVVLSNR